MTQLMARPGVSNEWRSRRTAELFAAVADQAGPDSDERRAEMLDEIVRLNLRIAHAIARRFEGRQIPLDDLEQVAALALVRAAQRFDLSQDRDFLSYAVPTMTGEIKRHFRDHGWAVRPPRRIQEIHAKVNRMASTGRDDGTPYTPAEIAQHLQVDVSDVEEALQAKGCFTPTSLDRQVTRTGGHASGAVSDGDQTFADLLRADDDAARDAVDARATLQPVLRRLSERDRRILALRFAHDQTQKEIGDDLGVTQMQVSRLLNRILNQLRDDLTTPDAARDTLPQP